MGISDPFLRIKSLVCNPVAVLLQGADAPSCQYLAAALAHNLAHWDVTHLHRADETPGETRTRPWHGEGGLAQCAVGQPAWLFKSCDSSDIMLPWCHCSSCKG